jgi:tetratricopeptide (TPR) repeat protein
VEDHPTAEDFERLLQRSPRPSSTQRNASVVRHLLAGCKVCRTTLREIREGKPLLRRLLDLPTPADQDPTLAHSYNYEWAFARAGRALSSHLAEGSAVKGLPSCLAELAGLSDREQIRRMSSGGRFASPELIRCLVTRSHAARYQSSRKTLHLANLARTGAEACTPEIAGGTPALEDLRAQAWGAYANAQRICGNSAEAEEAFTIAFQRQAGKRSPHVHAFLLMQLCALRIFQRRFQEAVGLAEEAQQIYFEKEESLLEASAAVQKATAVLYGGNAELAASILQRVIPQIDGEEDPHLLLAAHHNLARCYIDLNRPAEALSIFYNTRDLYQSCRDPLILLRATWQEGCLLRQIGHLQSAGAAFIRARRGFEEQGLAYEAAVVSLDLGDVYWKLGQLDQLRRTLAQAVPIFRSLRVDREVLASLLRLQQAAEMEPSSPPE